MDATERFDKRVIKSKDIAGCWVWVGALGDDGYGRFWLKDSATGRQKVYRAHRFALQVALGFSDAQMNLVHVLHRCDNPLCVRATDGSDSHLVVGDHELNMQDRANRRRQVVHGNRKVHVQKARELRDAIKANGYDQRLVSQFVLGLHPEQQTLF